MALDPIGARLILEGLATYLNGMRQAEQATSNFGRSTTTAGTHASGAGKAIGGMLQVAGGVLVAQAVTRVAALGTSVVKTGIEFNNLKQQATIAFTTMLGSGEKAKSFLDELQVFAAKTPFEFTDLIRATQRLTAMGFAAKDVIPTLTAVGDAASALGASAETIDRITLALGQMQAKGKVSGEEMRQLAEAGIPAWRFIAEEIGTSIPEAMKRAEQGTISASVAVKALVRGMEHDFGGMMEQQSRTFGGLLSTIKDTFTQISGTVLAPFFTRLTEGMQKLVDITGSPEFTRGIERFGEIMEGVTQSFITGFGATVIPGFEWFIKNQFIVAAAIGVMALAFVTFHPAGAIGLGLLGIIGLIGLMQTSSENLPTPLLHIKEKVLEIAAAFETAWLKAKRFFDSIPSSINVGVNIPIKGGPSDSIVADIYRRFGILPPQAGPASTAEAEKAYQTVAEAFGETVANATAEALPGAIKDSFSSSATTGAFESTAEAFAATLDENITKPQTGIQKALQDTRDELEKRQTAEEEGAAATEGAVPPIKEAGAATSGLGDAAGGAKEKVLTLKEAIEDSVISMAEAAELHLSPAAAGAIEATHALAAEQMKLEEESFNLGKAISGILTAAQVGGSAIASFTRGMIDSALALQRTAASAIFSRPTREEATLQLQLAQVERAIAGIELSSGPARAANEQMIRHLQSEIEIRRNHKAASDQEREAIEREIRQREEAIESLRKANEGLTAPYESLRDNLQKQIQLMQLDNQIQQLSLTLASQDLLNEAEQNRMTEILIGNINSLSGASAAAARALNESLSPEFNAAARAAEFVANAFYGAGFAIPGRQHGGPVRAGQPYMVGEGGVPELFVPRQSGMILPMSLIPSLRPSTITNQSTASMTIQNLNLPNVQTPQDFFSEMEKYQSDKLKLSARGVTG